MRDKDNQMAVEQVLQALDALDGAGCSFSLSGGWAVDALVGRQTRAHRDLDVDLVAEQEMRAVAVLERIGYRVWADFRPNRIELRAAGGAWVDVHPLVFDAEGNGFQAGTAGERYQYPAASFVTGSLLGRTVRCLSAAQQVEWHQGYEMRDIDRADLVLLRELADRERRPAIPGPPPDRRLAVRDEVLAAHDELRRISERHSVGAARVTPSGAVLIGTSAQVDLDTLQRFAAEAADAVGGWVNVVVAGTPWAPTTPCVALWNGSGCRRPQ